MTWIAEQDVATVPTLMVHGLWSRMGQLSRLRKVLQTDVGPTNIFPYDSSGAIPFETLGKQLAEEIRKRDEPVNIVAFSMGGLVTRAARMIDPSLPIRRVVFMNCPHKGSLLAYLLPMKGIRQMRPTSDFLRQAGEIPWNIPTLAVWCPLDTMVVPGNSARFERATQTIRCSSPVHIWPLYSGRIHRRIATFLNEKD